MPRARQYCRAILMATSTETDPESQRKTRWRGAGVTSTSSSASCTAGRCVSPPNMTCDIAPSCAEAAASSSGTAYPWTAAHHDDMPSTSCRPSSSVSVTPAACDTGRHGTGLVALVYGCQSRRTSAARSLAVSAASRVCGRGWGAWPRSWDRVLSPRRARCEAAMLRRRWRGRLLPLHIGIRLMIVRPCWC